MIGLRLMLIGALLPLFVPGQVQAPCAYAPPQSAWVETSLQVAERGHDLTQMITTTRVGVPVTWPGAAALWREGAAEQDDGAVACLLPEGTPDHVTVKSGGEVIVESRVVSALIPSAAPKRLTGGFWTAGVERSAAGGLNWRLDFAPGPVLPPGLTGARWRLVTLKVPELAVKDVAPTPTRAGVREFAWQAYQPGARITAAAELSLRSRFQYGLTSYGVNWRDVARFLAFLLPYLLLAHLALRMPRDAPRERPVALLLLTAIGLITLLKTAALFSHQGLLASVLLTAVTAVGVPAALVVVAWPLLGGWRRVALLTLGVVGAVAGMTVFGMSPLIGDGTDWTTSSLLGGLLLVGLALAVAVRAARVPDGAVPPPVRILLSWSTPAAAVLAVLLIAEPYIGHLLTGQERLVQPGLIPLYPIGDLLWPLVVLLLLILLRLRHRYAGDDLPRWTVAFLFVTGTIRWPGEYALIPFPLAALTGLAAMGLLLSLTRRRAIGVPEVSRRRLASIVAESRDLETRERQLRKNWANGTINDAEYAEENGTVVDRIRALRAEIGLNPDREDGVSTLDLALTRGPGASWWANARLAARYASVVGAPAAIFLIWATWSTDPLGRDGWLQRLGSEGGVSALAFDLISGLLIWPVAGFVMGALWRELPGRRGYLKPLIPVLAFAVAAASHGLLNNALGQAPVRGSLVRILLLFLVLTIVAVLMDARALQTRPGSWGFRLAPVAAVYRLGAAGSGVALIIAQLAAILGLWTQLRSGVDITSQSEQQVREPTSVSEVVTPPRPVR